MKKRGLVFALSMVMVLSAVILSGCGEKTDRTPADQTVSGDEFTSGSEGGEELPEVIPGESAPEETAVNSLDTSSLLTGIHHARIEVADYGTIDVELDADTAPITVTNFVKLAQEGFYDGLTFHRIISGFMIQGGDPNGNGTGGSDEKITGEFNSNGVENNISHVRGTISMARSQDPNSASSQFFIMHNKADYLDGEYAGFGHVTNGMDVVDKICENAHPTDSNGTIPQEEQPSIESIVILD